MGTIGHRTTAQSAASEAIFSNSGQVKKRIKNYETTVVDTSETILVFPPQQSDTDIDIPGVLGTVAEISSDESNTFKKPIRFTTALVSFIVAITFSWSIYSLFFTVKHDNQALDDANPAGNNLTVASSKPEELKLAADRLLAESTWTTEDIDSFLKHWNRLGDEQLQKVTKSSWYQLLEFNVKKQLKQQQSLADNKHVADQNDKSLMTLGLAMGVVEQPGEFKKSTDTSAKYESLLAELTSELKKAENISVSQNKLQDSESELYVKLREKYGAVKPDSAIISSPAKPIKSAKASAAVPSSLQAKPQGQHTVNKPQIRRTDVDLVISEYKRAYEKGDLNMMASLFGATSASSAEYEKVKSNFDGTFNNTVNRSMNFYDVKTESNGSSAIIDGKFNASVEFKNGKGTQYTVAGIKLYLSMRNDKVVVNQVNILDRKVNVVQTDRNLIANSNGMITAIDNKVSVPTAAELQDITTQLVSAYEAGNLKQFISLFSPEIKTNDRIDLSGVKKDYAQLFASTSDRQMFIQNLNWSNETIGAKGTGDLEVIILSNEGNPVYSMEGKIQIVAQKIDNKVKITHLYHIERAK